LRSRAWCDFATYARAKSRSGLRKPGYAGKNERDRVASVRAGSSQVLSATAVRAGPSCASTSGEGVLAIAYMIRFCYFSKNKSVTSKRKRRALEVMIVQKMVGWGKAHRED